MKYLIPNLSNITMIACGANFSMALNSFGEVFTWGDGSTGALGTGNLNPLYEPTRVSFEIVLKVRFISAGTAHAAAITDSGKVYTWGFGLFG
jgi:alpha-tubulin suppressor-like RCC1 family protein